jgi:SnoaL-like polyketide cyclase
MPHDLAKLREFGARYAAAWCSRDPNKVASFFSPTGSLKVNDGPPAAGRSAIAGIVHSFMGAFPDMQVLMNDLRLNGERVEFHWTLIGTNTGPGGTGHSVRISGFESWQIGGDGLIAASEGHFDAAEYQRQLEHGV